MMQLHSIKGGNETDLNQKKYNIGVGISLGNKWFTVENIIKLTRWSLDHTREAVVIYVADSIHAINLEVRKRISYERALQMSLDMGNKMLKNVKQAVEVNFSDEQKSIIHYAHWNDFVDEEYKNKRDFILAYYKSNENFRNKVQEIVRGYVSGGLRYYTKKEVDRLSMYIVEELPELIYRVRMNGVSIDAYAYPFDGKLVELAEDIQYGKVFSEVKSAVLNTEPKVFLEIR